MDAMRLRVLPMPPLTRRHTYAAPAFVLTLVVAIGVALASVSGQTTTGAKLGDRIPFEGRAVANGGIALWNTRPGAAEPESLGHATPWTLCSASASYYLATRDFSDLDVGSTAGLRGVPSVEGLPGFMNALIFENGFSVTELTVGWTAQTLGDDIEGVDWVFDTATGVETRYYRGGRFDMQLNGEALVGGSMPQTTLRIDYKELADCGDNEMSLHTDTLLPENRS